MTPAADDHSPSPTAVRLSANVAVLLRDCEGAYRSLLGEYEAQGTSGDLRAAALQLARRIAAQERLAIIAAEALVDVPDAYSPIRGLAALQRLSFALVALGREEPDNKTLISEDEFAQVLDAGDTRAWMNGVLDSVPDDWEAP